MLTDLPLHDALLLSVHLDYLEGTCVLRLAPVASGECELSFHGVSDFSAPRQQPWGPSHSVNEVRSAGIAYEVELQSGDVLRVVADSWSHKARESEGAL
jgi:hypothetical protein